MDQEHKKRQPQPVEEPLASKLVWVKRVEGTAFFRDDPKVLKSDKNGWLLKYQDLKDRYIELGDLLRWHKRDQTPANRKLRSKMAVALREAKTGRRGGGWRSSATRCHCNAMTVARAKARYHYCNDDGPLPSPRDMMRIRRAKWRHYLIVQRNNRFVVEDCDRTSAPATGEYNSFDDAVAAVEAVAGSPLEWDAHRGTIPMWTTVFEVP